MGKQVKNAHRFRVMAQQNVLLLDFFTKTKQISVSGAFRDAISQDVFFRTTVSSSTSTELLRFDIQSCKQENCCLCVRFPDEYNFCLEVGFSCLKWLLEQQLYGNEGDLLTNNRNNIFYVRMSEHERLLISAFFDTKEEQWHLDAVQPDAFSQWYCDDRVFTPWDGKEHVPQGECACAIDPTAKTAFIRPSRMDCI